MILTYYLSPYAALPQLAVTISHASGSPTAGQPYSLTCSAEVPHLVVEHGIVWTRQDGRPIEPSSVNSPQLYFDPLMTSNGSRYTCRAFLVVSRFVIHGSNSTNLVITSKLSNYYLSQNISYQSLISSRLRCLNI